MCLVMPNFCGSDQMISHQSAVSKLKFGRFLIAARADALAGGRADNKMFADYRPGSWWVSSREAVF